MLSFLFAVGLAWSFSVVGDRVGDTWGFLRLGLTIALIVSIGRLGAVYMKSRRRRRKEAEREAEREAEQSEAQGDQRLTYGEIFYGTPPDPDGHFDPQDESAESESESESETAMEDDEAVHADVDAHADVVDEDDEVEVEVIRNDAAEAEFDEAFAESDAVEPVDQGQEDDLDQFDQGDTIEVSDIASDLEADDSLQRMREEFKARAREAQLRLQQRDAESHEAPAAPNSP
jgi:hypothetical protein